MTKKPINVNIVPDIPDSTKEEALNPSANLVGQAFRGIAHKILDPLVRYNIVKDQEMDDFADKVRNKTSEIPVEHRSSEKLGLTFKATEDATYQLGSEELRDMFATLIASSVDDRINQKLHPSFSTILKDMSPEDAILFKKLYASPTLPSVTIRIIVKNDSAGVNYIENIVLGDHKELIHQTESLINLERLGLLNVYSDTRLVSEENQKKYSDFEKSEYVLSFKKQLPIYSEDLVFDEIKVLKGKVELTPFGFSFGGMVIS